MKKEILNLPFFLLLFYNALCYFRKPDMADCVIIFSLAALYGLRLFLISKESKEIEVDAERDDLKKQVDKLKMQREMAALSTEIVRINKNIQGIENAKERKLMF